MGLKRQTVHNVIGLENLQFRESRGIPTAKQYMDLMLEILKVFDYFSGTADVTVSGCLNAIQYFHEKWKRPSQTISRGRWVEKKAAFLPPSRCAIIRAP
jgi:hypothetical protein